MKKNAVLSAVVSFVLTGVGALVNWLYASAFKVLPLALISSAGGEFMESRGVGVCLQTIYSFGPIEEASTVTTVRFDPLGFAVCLAVLFAVVFVITAAAGALIRGIRHRRDKGAK